MSKCGRISTTFCLVCLIFTEVYPNIANCKYKRTSFDSMHRGNCNPRSCLERGILQRGILKCLVSHVLTFKSWIKIIHDTVDICNFVINKFNPTSEVQNMGNEAFEHASFPNENMSYSFFWAMLKYTDIRFEYNI